MKMPSLTRNALFLRFCRPQCRPARLQSVLGLFLMLQVAIIVGCYLLTLYAAALEDWADIAYGLVLGLQAVVLLLIGSSGVGTGASQESSSGALDFHRASPTPVADQVLGIVLGPGILAWLCFAAGIPGVLLCAILGRVSLPYALEAEASLVLSGVFLHVVSAVIGLAWPRRTGAATQPQGVGLGVIIGLLLGSGVMTGSPAPLGAFLVGIPALAAPVLAASQYEAPSHAFFGLLLPLLATQCIVQVPLVVFALVGLRRAIRQPGRPVLSKPVCLLLAAWLYILFMAQATARVQTGRLALVRPAGDEVLGTAMALFAMVVGGVLALMATPRYALFCAGLRRQHEGLPTGGILDDARSNALWAAAFGALTAAFYTTLWLASSGGLPPWPPFCAMLLYFGWLTQSLEWSRLRPTRRRGSLYPLLLAALWLILPLLGWAVVQSTGEWVAWACWLMSACPVFGIIASAKVTGGAGDLPAVGAVFAANAVLLVLFAALAQKARGHIRATVTDAGKPRPENR